MSGRPSLPGPYAPVAVGGVGGSGTRVVARILLELGLDLGPDRNQAEDNLWFTLLVRSIPARARSRARRVRAALDVFTRAMTHRPLSGAAHHTALLRAVVGATGRRSDLGPLWALKRAHTIRAACAAAGPPRPWGWKEPNTHVFLPELHGLIPDLGYIHVIRAGAEVATGRNRAQLHRWGADFGVDPARSPDPTRAAFKYWLRANVRALTYARREMTGRFLLVEHGALCERPEPEIDRIVSFLGVPVDPPQRQRLIALPDARLRRRAPGELVHELDEEDRAGLAFLGYG